MGGMPNLKVVVFPAPEIKIGFLPPDPLTGAISVNVSSQPDIRATISIPQVQAFVSGIPFFTFASASVYATTSSYASYAVYAENAFPYTGSAQITGSLSITGSAYFTDQLIIGPASLLGSLETLLNVGTSLSGSLFFVSASGRVGVGRTDPQYTLDVVGDIYASGDVLSLSDRRAKTDIYPIYGALDRLQWIQGVSYLLKDDNSPQKKRHIGFIAQDLQTLVPEVVFGSEEDGYSVSYGNMVALTVEAIKELDQRLKNVEEK